MTPHMDISSPSKYVVLAILDGWGIAHDSPGNAITRANTPNIDRLTQNFPHTQLTASGQAVGLPRGEDGNTETGHLNLGAGSIIYQDLERINMAIAEGSFFTNQVLIGAIEHAKENNSKLHLMGLLGAGGVHSNSEHIYAILHLCNEKDFRNVFLHIFTDGRDSPNMSSKTYISELMSVMKKENVGTIASVMGRYWAMDRDLHWDRTEKAFNALTMGVGNHSASISEAIDQSYKKGLTDEFIEPTVIVDKSEKPIALIGENDSVLFFNFRVDRPRQLSKAFVFEDFSLANQIHSFDPHSIDYEKSHVSTTRSLNVAPFQRKEKIKNLYFATMTEYEKPLTEHGAKPAFPPKPVRNPIGKVVSESGKKQLRITESEKERFVTYYFNGLREEPFEGEEKIIVPSPAVPTYDLQPEMSCPQVTESVLSSINTNKYQFIVVNFPNADMVGHTGSIGPAVKAIETVDEAVGKLAEKVLYSGGTLVVTADHGNAEEMINLSTGHIDTEHSTNPVPFIVVDKRFEGKADVLPNGILADVAPTILALLGIAIPAEMTGSNLLS